MTVLKKVFLLIALFYSLDGYTQKSDKRYLDSIYIANNEIDESGIYKVFHAEPLYIDLIRDLGARKGEKEWNVGAGITDKLDHDEYSTLVEYEWAVANRVGLEIELPFSFTKPLFDTPASDVPNSKLEGLKTAIQYSFLVSPKYKSTLAIGYINELEFTSFKEYGNSSFLKGNVYNPFLVAAKRWGQKYHTLLYTGPKFEHSFKDKKLETSYEFNFSLHYMIGGSRNFIGIENNVEKDHEGYEYIIRPQMRVGLADNLLIGIVTGIPILTEKQRFSTFIRLIYEPGQKHH